MSKNKKHTIQVVVDESLKAELDEMAKQQGISTSKLGKVFITKAMKQEVGAEDAKARAMVESGLCPDVAEAKKLLRALRGEWQ